MAKPAENPLERFWGRVDVRGPDECWEWTARRRDKGYGEFYVGRKSVAAHRFSWQVANGASIPPGMFICHRCDNPPCVNPAHLFLGTPGDNTRDMWSKGRGSQPPEVIRYGAENSQWKGGRSKTSSRRYATVRAPEHPRSSNAYVLERVLVAETAVGHPLPAQAIVADFDGQLVVCEDRAYHMLLRRRGRALAATGNPDALLCNICKKYDDPAALYVLPSNGRSAYHRDCKREYQRARKRARRNG